MRFPGVKSYPKEIIIRKTPWQVKFVRRCPDPTAEGLCDPGEKIIYIKLKQKPIDIFKTFLHECLHAIEDEYCLTLPHKGYVYKLEQSVVDFIFQNFELIVFFVDALASRKADYRDEISS